MTSSQETIEQIRERKKSMMAFSKKTEAEQIRLDAENAALVVTKRKKKAKRQMNNQPQKPRRVVVSYALFCLDLKEIPTTSKELRQAWRIIYDQQTTAEGRKHMNRCLASLQTARLEAKD